MKELILKNMIDKSRKTHLGYICVFSRRKWAKKLGVSASCIWYIIKKLQKSKKIISYYSKGRNSLYLIKGNN